MSALFTSALAARCSGLCRLSLVFAPHCPPPFPSAVPLVSSSFKIVCSNAHCLCANVPVSPPLPTICPFHHSPSRDWYHLKLILFLLLVTFFLNCYCFAQFCFSLLFHKIHFTHMHQHLLVFYSLIPCALVLYLC